MQMYCICLISTSICIIFFFMISHLPRSTLFPYTTLFRSKLNATAEMFPISWPEISKLHPFAPSEQTAGYTEICKQRSEEHTSELQSRGHLVCRLLLEKKKKRP